MPAPINTAARPLIQTRGLRLCTLFKLTRVDGVIKRYTDHDGAVVFEGQTFNPAAGVVASARQRVQGVQQNTVELRGYLSSPEITNDDLRRGKYRDAKVEEWVVDWRYPFAGALQKHTWFVRDCKFDGETWQMQLDGLLSRLERPVGFLATKKCRADLGDAGCKVALGPLTLTGEVTSVVTQRLVFQSTQTSQGNDWFNDGLLTWTSGNNNGETAEVKDYTQTNGVFTLHLRTNRDVQVGDDFTVYPGCNKVFTGDCLTKFNNTDNFRGFPTIPGTDKSLDTPVSQ